MSQKWLSNFHTKTLLVIRSTLMHQSIKLVKSKSLIFHQIAYFFGDQVKLVTAQLHNFYSYASICITFFFNKIQKLSICWKTAKGSYISSY